MDGVRKQFFGEEVGEDGSVRRFFQDHFGGEDWDFRMGMWMAETQYEDYAAQLALEELHRQTDNFDPNTCDTRRARRELGDKFINLGHRANRVPSTARRV